MVHRTWVVVGLAALALPAAGPAQNAGPPRLEGTWDVSLVFTVAEGLQDRQVGQKVTETWRLRPRCAKGACAVELRRAGRVLLLRPTKTGYRGTASFEGTFFCNGRAYAGGTTYVETWVVRVRRSEPSPRGRVARRITGVGATVGRSKDGFPCAPVVSREGVELSGVLR